MYLFLTNLCSPAFHIRRHLIFQVSAGTMSSWLHPGLEQPNLCDSTWAGQNASYHFRLAPFPLLRVTLHDNYMPHYISQEINVHHQPSTADCHLSRSVDSVAEIQNNWWDFCIFFFNRNISQCIKFNCFGYHLQILFVILYSISVTTNHLFISPSC